MGAGGERIKEDIRRLHIKWIPSRDAHRKQFCTNLNIRENLGRKELSIQTCSTHFEIVHLAPALWKGAAAAPPEAMQCLKQAVKSTVKTVLTHRLMSSGQSEEKQLKCEHKMLDFLNVDRFSSIRQRSFDCHDYVFNRWSIEFQHDILRQ